MITESLRSIGAVNGYITFLHNREEDIRKGPFELGSYAIVFMNGEQAKAYFKAVKQRYIDDGLQRFDYNYDDLGIPADPSATYVQRQTVQGYHFMQSYTLAYEGNVFISTYTFDLEERRNSLNYSFWMFNKFAPGVNPDATAVNNASQTTGE